MTQDAVVEREGEVTNVPDVICPNCFKIINVPLPTYAWYRGQIGCQECQARVSVKIGNWEPIIDGIRPRTRPFGRTIQGGLLLEEPELIDAGSALPSAFVRDMESTNLPEGPRKAMRTAVQHYKRRNYQDATVRCRFAIQGALLDLGVPDSSIRTMITKAKDSSVITAPLEPLCLAVAAFGNKGAHPQDEPAPIVTRDDALMVIGMTANVLRTLYLG